MAELKVVYKNINGNPTPFIVDHKPEKKVVKKETKKGKKKNV